MDEKELGTNISSGAEKVESIEAAAAKEREAAKQRVEDARARLREQEEKQKHRQQMYRSERSGDSKNGQGNGRENGNSNHQNNQSAGKNGQENGSQKKDSKRGDGLGGWIAAVVSLGVVSLALTAIVTVGAIKMRSERSAVAAAYRGTMYEIMHIVEEVDDDLENLRISEDPAKQAELLTDVLVQTRMAEADLEKLPVDGQNYSNTMRFLNTVSMHCERMLDKLAHGEKLTERDKELLEEFYECDHEIREALDELAAKMEDGDMMCLLKGKENCITKTLQGIENGATPKMPKNEKANPPKADGNILPMPPQNGGGVMPMPPTGDSSVLPMPRGSKMQDRARVTSQQAEELCRKYFADYSLSEVAYEGETLGKGLKAYNFEMKTQDGVSMFAKISQFDGSLIYFDYYKECKEHVYDIETAKNMAVSFLEKLGYENMIPVGIDESGTNADFKFVYYADGCTYYPDEIIVKVCEERGIVSGLDASQYLKNHRGRVELNGKITMQEAREKLCDKLSVEASRLVLFEHKGREMAAYEFFCSYDGQMYFLYLDAMDGRELFIVNSKNR